MLARKWRPRDFDSLVGQEHVVRALRHGLETGRVHHAYLLTGTRGVGKTTVARILAKCLNCETGVGPRPCGGCGACREIDAGRFPDYVEMDAASNRRVEEMTQLLERALYAPASGRFRVYVIDEVHQLSGHAFNAMLKTLEEPPPHLKFVLATTDPQKVPITVLSRCLQLNLRPLSAEQIAGHLAAVLAGEGLAGEPAALALLARAAAGSMRDALSLLDQAIAHGGGRVEAESVRAMLGTVDAEPLHRLLEAVARGNAREAVAVADEIEARSLSYDWALRDLAEILLRVALAQFAPQALTGDSVDCERIVPLARELDPEEVQLYYQIALQGREDLARAPDERAGFVMTVLRMIAFAPDGEHALPARLADVSQPGTVSSVSAAPDDWRALVARLAVSGAARELARNAELVRREEDVIELAVPQAFAHLAEGPCVERLRGAIATAMGRPVRLSITVDAGRGGSPAAQEAVERAVAARRALQALREDRFVKELVTTFEGRLIEETIRPVGERPRR